VYTKVQTKYTPTVLRIYILHNTSIEQHSLVQNIVSASLLVKLLNIIGLLLLCCCCCCCFSF